MHTTGPWQLGSHILQTLASMQQARTNTYVGSTPAHARTMCDAPCVSHSSIAKPQRHTCTPNVRAHKQTLCTHALRKACAARTPALWRGDGWAKNAREGADRNHSRVRLCFMFSLSCAQLTAWLDHTYQCLPPLSSSEPLQSWPCKGLSPPCTHFGGCGAPHTTTVGPTKMRQQAHNASSSSSQPCPCWHMHLPRAHQYKASPDIHTNTQITRPGRPSKKRGTLHTLCREACSTIDPP